MNYRKGWTIEIMIPKAKKKIVEKIFGIEVPPSTNNESFCGVRSKQIDVWFFYE